MIKTVKIKVKSLEALKEEIAKVEEIERMTISDLDALMEKMTAKELNQFQKWLEKWGLI